MAKFNFNSIRNASANQTMSADNPTKERLNENGDNIVTEQVEISVGAGLLNDNSKEAAADLGNIFLVQRNKLFENADNFYSIDGIDELTESIASCGLLQPLLLKETEQGFLVLGGHRRLAAIDRLISEGRWNKEIPGILQNMDRKVFVGGMELDERQKEQYLLITQNKTSRKYTAADTSKEIRMLREILYGDTDPEEVEADKSPEEGQDQSRFKTPSKPKRRKGGSGRARTQIAKELGISEGKVGQHEYVEKHGTDELKAVMEEGNVSAPVAAKIAKLDEESQKELIEGAAGGEIKAADVREYMESKVDPHSNVIDKNRLMYDLKPVLELVNSPVSLDEVGYQSYIDCMGLLAETLKEGLPNDR